jgi:Rps23 Pro-64 3,4-dihydroxylase Tpa1-like proline 4-hydroxylase
MSDNTLLVIYNVFNDKERDALSQELNNYSWLLDNYSHNITDRLFWSKRLFYPRYSANRYYDSIICKDIFKSRIEIATKQQVEILRVHHNGQTHGQSGNWHTDSGCHEPSDIVYSLVYFPIKWQPEYGGHLLVKVNNEVQSILPEFNKGVIFRTTAEHLALEPSIYCKTMRESISCCFKVLT